MKCEICGKEFETIGRLSSHIGRVHKNEITREEYYLKYIGEKGKCPECGKDATFKSLKHGYNKYCYAVCSNNSIEVINKKKETYHKRTGYNYPMQNPESIKKRKQTCFEKTGYDNPMKNPKIIEKSNKIKLQNNNGIHPLKLTYKKLKERYPDLVKIEELIEGPNLANKICK